MLDRVPVTLPGLAATVWLAAGDPVGLADLVHVATASHGPHPDAEEVVTGTVASLVAQGLLRTGARASASVRSPTRRAGSARPGPR